MPLANPLTLVQVMLATAFHAAFAGMAGIVASELQLQHLQATWCDRARQRLQAAMPWCIGVAVLALLLMLWTEAATMGDLPWHAAWPAFRVMMISTHAGTVGAMALVVLAALAIVPRLLRSASSSTVKYVVPGVLLLLLAAIRAAAGHAFEDGLFSISVFIAWMHLTFMAIWAGCVGMAGWLVLPALSARHVVPGGEAQAGRAAREDRGRYLRALSGWATFAVAGIVATGIYNAWHALGSPGDLTGTSYGQTLLWKLLLVAIAVLLGGINRFLWLPATNVVDTRRPDAAARALRAFVIVLRIETVVLLGVFLAAAMLAISAPPGA